MNFLPRIAVVSTLAAILFASLRSQAIVVADYSVQVSARVQESPPQITLAWPADPDSTAYTLYRKTRDATSWGSATTLATNATGYVDSNVVVGATYEYRIIKSGNELGSGYTGQGYIYAGIQAPLIENRGKLLLIVDNTMTNALVSELQRLQFDLIGDGWTVIRRDVARVSTPPVVKAVITNEYYLDTNNVKSVFLLGHVPVPYSGSLAPDGHGDHVGAWPADVYYADVNGTWTDSTLTSTNGSRTENKNVPGDGKFDQTSLPSNLELQVGRVDLWNMPSFSLSETELLRQYLNREHHFRVRNLNPPRRGLVDDHFGTFGGEAFAANGYRNFAPFFGYTNIATGPWFSTLQNNSYLWGYACGGGSYTSESGVGTTANFAQTNTQVMFTMHFGSYFGDYDAQNDFMRAQLANAAGGLSCAWAGRPHWFFHHMALGEALGFSAFMTENYGGTLYNGYSQVHVNLLGDPSLRMHVVVPPSALNVTDAAGTRTLTWRASPDLVLGYNVYGAPSIDGTFTRLNGAMLTDTNFVDASSGSAIYMVRALKLETSASGTYTNASEGIFENVANTFSPPTITLTSPTNGALGSLGTPISLTVSASDANNDITQVEYYTNGVLLGSASVWPYTFSWTNAWLGTYGITAVARDAAGLSATSAVANITVTYATTTLVPIRSVWKFNDVGTDLGTAWRAPGYDDSTWLSGPAQLGFGDGDEATAIDSNRMRITTYFRQSFVPSNGSYLGLSVNLLRDDGGVVYLNGTEVFRSNMPTNQTILWGTQAAAVALTQDESTQFYSSSVNLSLLHAGTNVLAVEIHQFGTNSSDLSFDLSLVATNLPAVSNTAPTISSIGNVVVNEDTASAPVAFVIGDRESWPEALTVTASSSTPSLIASSNITFTGTSSNRSMVILPATNQNGSATVTLTVSDGVASTSTNFVVTVNAIADAPNIAWVALTNGSFLPAGSVTLSVTASDPEGNLSAVQYFLDGTFIGQSTVAPYSFIWSSPPVGYHHLQARASDSTSLTSATSNILVTILGTPGSLVGSGALWKYWDLGSLPAANWTTAAYNDSAWPAGPSPLGYGDANGTVFPATTNSYGPNSNAKYVTTYYRRTITVSDPASLTNMIVSYQRDDGVVIYLNGTEIARNNVTNNPVVYTNWASATVNGVDEVTWYSNSVNSALLVNGQNILAAEVHQVTTNSSDLFFNLTLTVQTNLQPPSVTAVPGGGNTAQFSWPSWAAGLTLCTATSVVPPVVWTPITNGTSTANGQVTVTVSNSLPTSFYQLRAW